jgi:two-component system, LuxR family, response regulator FixJ
MAPEMTVFVVDDDADVRDSLAMFLGTCGLPVQAFASAGAFLDAVPASAEGCLLLDITLPDMSGLALQRALHARGSELPVIFITAHHEIPLAVEAIKEGAMDFLQKPLDDGRLLDCVYRALESDQQRRAARAQRQKFRAQLDALTPRETEVLQHLLDGEMTKCIAGHLGISPRTAELHRARLMKKMGCRTLAQLAHKVSTAAVEFKS